jgi:hypothetical protein
MKIENPMIKNAINKVAVLLDISPCDVLDHYLGILVQDMEKNPIQPLLDLVEYDFQYETKAQAEAVAHRLNGIFSRENLEGSTNLEYTVAVVDAGEHFCLEVTQHHPKFGALVR